MVCDRLKAVLFLVCCLWTSSSYAVTLRELTATPLITNIKISPTGAYLAVRIFQDDKHHLRFVARDSFSSVGEMSFRGNNEVGNFYWINDERVVAEVREIQRGQEAPKNFGELYAANFDGTEGELIFGYRSGQTQVGSRARKKDADYAWAEIIDILPNDERQILVSSTNMSRSYHRSAVAILLDAYTGFETKRIKKSAFPGANFYTDADGSIRFITSRKSDNSLHLQALPLGSTQWIEIPESKYGNQFEPIVITEDKKSVYVLDNFNSDKIGLHELSLDGENYSHIYTHDNVDITLLLKSTDGNSVYAARVDNGYPSYLIFPNSGEEATTFKKLLKYFSGATVSIGSRSRDGRYWIVKVETDVDPGSYHLLDREAAKISKLFDSRPEIDSEDLAFVEPIEFESFDGLTISGYYTPAKNSSKEIPPLVVLVHGGPIARDYWGYDEEVQALATNGFSVLQFNYRGSAGYGKQFEEAGYLEWGDAIQRDIISGTKWAIEQDRATRGNICIMGASFGAYSAVQSAILAPDLFNCVVANAGIYDLSLMYKKGDIESRYGGAAYLEKVIGLDQENLRKFSPVNRIADLQAPVLIAHGKKDRRAPFEHAKRLRKAMDKYDKQYEWFVKRREAHGFYDNDNQVDYLRAAIAFLNKYLSTTETQ